MRIPLGLCLIIVSCTSSLTQAETRGAIQAGTALVDITPPIGGKTTGYSNAPPTDGIHDPITARILVLKSAQTQVAIVVLDTCIFNSPWLHAQAKTLGLDRLLILNTHSHSGPNFSQLDFPTPDEPWQKTVEQRIAAAIQDAQAKWFPAYFSAAEGEIQLGYNRLVQIQGGRFAETHFENPDRIPYGDVDPTVSVIRITDQEGTTRVLLVSYACHPVVLGPRNAKLSADYPGVMRKRLEEKLDPQAFCIFTQGAGGDINPLILARGDDRDGDFEMVERMGQLLANQVINVLEKLKSQTPVSKRLLSASRSVSVRNRWNPEQSVELGVTTLLINDNIAVMTMPGEPFHEFQVDWRRKAGVEHAIMFGYCCDGPYSWPSYLPDITSAARGGYGASDRTEAEVGAGELLVNHGLAQLFQLQGRLKSSPQRHTFDMK